MKLILASTSPYRKIQLQRLYQDFSTERPLVDEDAYKAQIPDPELLARRLAQLKAENVFERHPNDLVIGGDQVASFQGKILGKPHTFEKALEQLSLMQGQSHQLFTALHLKGPRISLDILEVTTLTMRPLTTQEIDAYLKKDQPYDCAGSYKIEESGIKLFSQIVGEDKEAIMGVPLMKLQTHLLNLGFPFF
jgi:septum formation protein